MASARGAIHLHSQNPFKANSSPERRSCCCQTSAVPREKLVHCRDSWSSGDTHRLYSDRGIAGLKPSLPDGYLADSSTLAHQLRGKERDLDPVPLSSHQPASSTPGPCLGESFTPHQRCTNKSTIAIDLPTDTVKAAASWHLSKTVPHWVLAAIVNPWEPVRESVYCHIQIMASERVSAAPENNRLHTSAVPQESFLFPTTSFRLRISHEPEDSTACHLERDRRSPRCRPLMILRQYSAVSTIRPIRSIVQIDFAKRARDAASTRCRLYGPQQNTRSAMCNLLVLVTAFHRRTI